MDEYLCSDGIGIYQNASVNYPLSVANNRLIVGSASNEKQVSFGCGVTVIYEEHVVRLSENGVEETIQYTQSGGSRASVTAIIDGFLVACSLGAIVPATPETINALNCTGAATPTTFPSKLDRVVIVQDKPFVVCADQKMTSEQNQLFFKAGTTVNLSVLVANSSLPLIHQVNVSLASLDAVAELTRNLSNGVLGSTGSPINPILMKYLDPLNQVDFGVTSSEWSGIKYNDNTLEACSGFTLKIISGTVSVAWTAFKL